MVCLTYSFCAQQKIVVSQPEYRILYTHYDNKIECLSTDDDSISVETKNPTEVEILKKTDENSNPFFVVRPQRVPEITLDFYGYKNGKSHLIKSIVYQVRVYPKAEVTNVFLSKGNSNKLEMSYPMYFPITASFTILGGAIKYKGENLVFSGDTIPPTLIFKIKNGEKVGIQVTYRETGKPNIYSCEVVMPVMD